MEKDFKQESYYIEGILVQIDEPVVYSPKFTKQEFVLHQPGEHEQFIKMMVVNTRIPQLLKVKIGDEVEVAFNIKGQKWNNASTGQSGINTNLQAYEINKKNYPQQQ